MVVTEIRHIASDVESSGHSSIERLAERLRDGYDMIERARASGQSVDRWEDHWLHLLQQYELAYTGQTKAT